MMKSIQEIKFDFQKSISIEDLKLFIEQYENDQRKGVQKLIEQSNKKIDNIQNELDRVKALYTYENHYTDDILVCGLDEVGRGPLAGPVVAAAVILPRNLFLEGVNDSKKLSPSKREALYNQILENAIDVGVGIVDHKIIDEINILEATKQAMLKAIQSLKNTPQVLLIDALKLPINIKQVSIIKGDQKSASIAAASIVAKVVRDEMMKEYDKLYPGYDFASNMGYGTNNHYLGLRRQGLSPIHRRSFVHL